MNCRLGCEIDEDLSHLVNCKYLKDETHKVKVDIKLIYTGTLEQIKSTSMYICEKIKLRDKIAENQELNKSKIHTHEEENKYTREEISTQS